MGVAEREVEMKQAQVADRERRLVADVRMKAGELLAARRNLGTTTDLSTPTGRRTASSGSARAGAPRRRWRRASCWSR